MCSVASQLTSDAYDFVATWDTRGTRYVCRVAFRKTLPQQATYTNRFATALAHQLYPIGLVSCGHLRLHHLPRRSRGTPQASDHRASVDGRIPRHASWYRESIHRRYREQRSRYRRYREYFPLLRSLLHVVRTGQLDLPVRDLPHELASDGNVSQYGYQLGQSVR